MQQKMMKTAKLLECGAEYNPRTISPEALEGLKKSIKEFGMVQPIVINKKTGKIISGHQRSLACSELGIKELPVIEVDFDVAKEKALNIAMNNNLIGGEFTADLQSLIADIEAELGTTYIEELRLDDLIKQVGHLLEEGPPLETPTRPDTSVKGSLFAKFGVPPFSVLDGRAGYWKERKQQWRVIIDDRGQAREGATFFTTGGIQGCPSTQVDTGLSILDPVLAELAISWYTPHKGAACFDCFAGDTVFGYVAQHKGHTFTGIELRQEQADFNNALCGGLTCTYICDDGRNVAKHLKPASQDLFFSCPPYYDLEVYSDKENDASNQDTYEEFYAILDKAFKESMVCLKNDSFAVVVCGDVRDKKTGAYYAFPDSIKQTFKEAGLHLYNEMILLDPVGSAPSRAGSCMRTRKVVKVHQNVLVFYKGNPKNIQKKFPVIEVEVPDDAQA